MARVFTIIDRSFDQKAHKVTFTCRDLEQDSWNPCSSDANFIPKTYEVSYDLHDGEMVDRLYRVITTKVPEAEDFTDGYTALGADGKPLEVTWNKDDGWKFKY
ncbi:MAG: hypothetical protein K6A74_09950 [Lachnospiraceae bacterium]|nr:hypothetical protein [Lachnospiraceae bacterium]